MSKGPMDKANEVRIVFGNGVWVGQGRATERGEWGQLSLNNKKMVLIDYFTINKILCIVNLIFT